MRSILILLAACGAPVTGPDSAAPVAKGADMKLIPHASITSGELLVCNESGHVNLMFDASADGFRFRPDPPRAKVLGSVTRGGRAWSLGESVWTGDMSQALTIDQRLRDETPALWAKTTVAPSVWLDVTGLDRARFEQVLERLDDPNGAHHQLGALQLHVAGVFDGFLLTGPDELYGARFARKSQWVQTQPAKDFAGAKFWWTAYQQGTNDHTGAPYVPAWHGEAAIGPLVLEVHAVGAKATEARFLDYARVAIEAALVDPTAACRERSGHMGT